MRGCRGRQPSDFFLNFCFLVSGNIFSGNFQFYYLFWEFSLYIIILGIFILPIFILPIYIACIFMCIILYSVLPLCSCNTGFRQIRFSRRQWFCRERFLCRKFWFWHGFQARVPLLLNTNQSERIVNTSCIKIYLLQRICIFKTESKLFITTTFVDKWL